MDTDRSTKPSKFFSDSEKNRILEAIREAEKETSGEIRLHLEEKVKEDIYAQAVKVFEKIGMTRTQQRNGVLIFLATGNRKFVILGDKGIDSVVPDDFWEDVVRTMTGYFAGGKFCEGVCEGIKLAGEKLKSHFPYRKDDVNELPDEISTSEK